MGALRFQLEASVSPACKMRTMLQWLSLLVKSGRCCGVAWQSLLAAGSPGLSSLSVRPSPSLPALCPVSPSHEEGMEGDQPLALRAAAKKGGPVPGGSRSGPGSRA